MIVRGSWVVAVLAGLLLASRVQAQYTFNPRQHGNMEAVLTAEAGKQTPERGRGEATLTLMISGPATLDVEEPRLGDAAAAWKEERSANTTDIQGDHAVWKQVIRLKQVKPGLEPLADLSVRFRRGPEADWVEEKWTDILRHVRVPSSPLPEEEGPSWLRRWGFVLILAATGLLILLAWLGKRRGIRRELPLPPDQWAEREIERIEKTLLPPLGEAEMFHTQMSYVVRRYLAERFGLHALQQTTLEFLEAVRLVPQTTAPEPTFLHFGDASELDLRFAAQQQELLVELFERCDLAKFARGCTTPEECLRTVQLARDLITQTRKNEK